MWALIQFDWCPYTRDSSDPRKEERQVTMKAEVGMMLLQVEEHQGARQTTTRR